MKQNFDHQYRRVLYQILDEGQERPNRTGNDTKAIPSACIQHDFKFGFPLLTLKRVPLRIVAVELEGFLHGVTDKQWFKDRGCNIWNAWTNPELVPYGTSEKAQAAMAAENDLGPIYGRQWRAFGAAYQPVPQLPAGLSPTVRGVGHFNHPGTEIADKLKTVWYNMIDRCYNPENKNFAIYGGRGVYVANPWLVFSTFVQDCTKLENWGAKQADWKKWSLDKDLKSGICYSKETCCWSTKSEQSRHTRSNSRIRAEHTSGEVREFEHLQDCAAALQIHPTSICKVIAGRYTHAQHWTFTRLDKKAALPTSVDQLQLILDKLKSDPSDRRMVCSAWNPNDQHKMALPPCHYAWQVIVINNTLHLNWTQRSADWFLGVPFDMASYALLAMLLAIHGGFLLGTVTGFFGDTHLYSDQLEPAWQLLRREIRQAPTVLIPRPTPVLEWTHDNLEVVNYNPHSAIKVAVAV